MVAEENCLFCKIIAGEIPSNKVYEDENIVGFYDINPQAPEHILIVPKKHIAMIDEIDEDDLLLVGKLVFAAKKIANDKKFIENSFRLVFNNGKLSGQEVFHIHLHLLGGRKMQWPPG